MAAFRRKNPDNAIRVACRAGVPLRIAAKVDRVDQEYFESTIGPLLGHPLVEFLGEVNEQQKHVLLRGALALLFPIDWPEPFGLVMIEALACGTSVSARPRGSVPEILQDGVTGFLCETDEEMIGAIRWVQTLVRERCREEFARRFTAEVMAQRYLKVYQRILDAQAGRAAVLREIPDIAGPSHLSQLDNGPHSILSARVRVAPVDGASAAGPAEPQRSKTDMI